MGVLHGVFLIWKQVKKTSKMASNCEAYFKNSIQMALQNNFSWKILALMLDEMTPTLSKTKELVKVLLNELQTLQKKHQEFIGERAQLYDKVQCETDEIEILENKSTLDEIETSNVEAIESNCNLDKDSNQDSNNEDKSSTIDEEAENHENSPDMNEENLDQFYIFVGSNDEKKASKLNNLESNMNTDEDNEIVLNDDFNVPELEGALSEDEHRQKSKSAFKVKRYECNICAKIFKSHGGLSKHKTIIHKEKTFECLICNKTFFQLAEKKQHEKFHSGIRSNECKTCTKKFIYAHHLRRHERIHNGENPFECKICNKVFTQSPDLKKHERIHTGEVPYECLECSKRFRYSSNLNKHQKMFH